MRHDKVMRCHQTQAQDGPQEQSREQSVPTGAGEHATIVMPISTARHRAGEVSAPRVRGQLDG